MKKRFLPIIPAKIWRIINLLSFVAKTKNKVGNSAGSAPLNIDEATNWHRLPTLTVEASYHNAGSIDQNPERFENALRNKNILELELDVIYYQGHLLAAHGTKTFARYAQLNPEAVEQQKLEKRVKKCIKADKAIHFDIKNSVRNKYALESLARLVNSIPRTTRVMFSGNNWALQESIQKRVTRPHKMLFTVNGHLHTWEDYEKKYLNSTVLPHSPIGVSIKNNLVNPYIIKALNAHSHHSQVYWVDTATAAVAFDKMGVTGITSNNEELLSILGKRTIQKRGK